MAKVKGEGLRGVDATGKSPFRKKAVKEIGEEYGSTGLRGAIVREPVGRRKRTVPQREADLVVISDMYLKGATQQQITQEINRLRAGSYSLTVAQIGRDIADVLVRWQRHYLGSTEERVGTELARLAKVEAELWEAWEKSKTGDFESSTGETSGENNGLAEESPLLQRGDKTPDPGSAGAMSRSKSFIRVRKSEKVVRKGANPEYMKMIIDVVKFRSQLLGLIMQRASITVDWRREAQSQGIDPDKVIDLITEAMVGGKSIPPAIVEGSARDAE